MQEPRLTQFAALDAPRGRIVMLGDSITEFGLWSEWLPGAPMANRGVGGDLSSDVLARLGTAIDQPLGVFLLVGTNDVAAAVPLPEIARNVAAIVDTVTRSGPGVPVFVQSVMPRSLVFRDELVDLNGRYQAIVEAASQPVHYLDLWPAVATADGALSPQFTQDALHLNGAGYRAWVDVLRPVITQIQTEARAVR